MCPKWKCVCVRRQTKSIHSSSQLYPLMELFTGHVFLLPWLGWKSISFTFGWVIIRSLVCVDWSKTDFCNLSGPKKLSIFILMELLLICMLQILSSPISELIWIVGIKVSEPNAKRWRWCFCSPVGWFLRWSSSSPRLVGRVGIPH